LFLTGQVDGEVIKTNSLTINFLGVIGGGKSKEPKVGKTVYQQAQALSNRAACNRLPSGEREQAEQSRLVRHLGIKALIRFQLLPLLLTS